MENEKIFYDLSEDTISQIEALIEKLALPFSIKFKFLGSTKLKKVVKLQKLSDIYTHLTGYDMIIMINEDLSARLDEKTVEILLYQELDRIETNFDKGTVKIIAYPLQTTTGVLKKYGIDEVSNANNLGDLAFEQMKDQESDSENDNDNTSNLSSKPFTSTSVEFLNED